MRRYDSLDSIRGIAALAVVFSHMLITFPIFWSLLAENKSPILFVNILAFTPLHLLWAGHEAVMLFFILSGFVLSLPYLNDRKLIYSHYVVQRFFRIYIPYIVIIFISIFLQSFIFSPHGFVSLSKWLNWMWMLPFNFEMLFHLIFMTGEYTHNYDTVAWSLVHEMRISLFFPFIVFFFKKTSLTQDIVYFLLLLISSTAIPINLPFELSKTLYYLLFFVMGSMLAKHRDAIGTLLQNSNNIIKGALFVSAFLLYGWHWNFGLLITESNYLWKFFNDHRLIDLAAGIASCIFFMFAIHSRRVEKALTHRIPLFLGKISYSLYLVHPVVLLTLLYSLESYLNPIVIVIMVPFVSIFIAYFYNKWVENSAMKAGKLITSSNLLRVKNNSNK